MDSKFPKSIIPTVKNWIVEKRKLVFSAIVFEYYKQTTRHPEQNKKADFDIIECRDWAIILAFDDQNRLLMVEQYRMGAQCRTLEAPGGVIHDDEDPLMSAQRELREECGYIASDWKKLGEISPNPAFMSNYCHFYLAKNLKLDGPLKLDPLEDIAVHLVPWKQVEVMIKNGEINHSLILAGLALYMAQNEEE